MLSIILTVLKIIGIAILVLLAVVIVLLLLLLFVPIVYHVEGHKKDENYNLHARFSWFGILLKGRADFTKEDGLSYVVKLFWKKIASSESEEDESSESKRTEKKRIVNEGKNKEQKQIISTETEPLDTESLDAEPLDTEPLDTESSDTAPSDTEPSHVEPSVVEYSDIYIQDIKSSKSEHEDANSHKYFYEYILSFYEFVISLVEHITVKVSAILSKIQNGILKTAQLLDYLIDPRFQNGVELVLKEVGRLLWHIRPRKGKILIHFGFDDPSMTGQILGFLSIVRTRTKKILQYQSEFEYSVLDLDMNCKGILQLYILLIIVAKLFFSKDFNYLRKGPFPEDSQE